MVRQVIYFLQATKVKLTDADSEHFKPLDDLIGITAALAA